MSIDDFFSEVACMTVNPRKEKEAVAEILRNHRVALRAPAIVAAANPPVRRSTLEILNKSRYNTGKAADLPDSIMLAERVVTVTKHVKSFLKEETPIRPIKIDAVESVLYRFIGPRSGSKANKPKLLAKTGLDNATALEPLMSKSFSKEHDGPAGWRTGTLQMRGMWRENEIDRKETWWVFLPGCILQRLTIMADLQKNSLPNAKTIGHYAFGRLEDGRLAIKSYQYGKSFWGKTTVHEFVADEGFIRANWTRIETVSDQT